MTADIVTNALIIAWFRWRPVPELLHHADWSSPYASPAFQSTLREYGMTCLMSRTGNCWDNAPTNNGFNSFKNERDWGCYATHADLSAAGFEYIEVFYHRRRSHSTLGYRSPFNSWNIGSASCIRKNWSHETNSLEDEKQRKARITMPTCHNLKCLSSIEVAGGVVF